MLFSLFEYLDSVNCNHREYVQVWQLFDKKNAITFDLKEIERKKRYIVVMKFCCASNPAIKIVKIARKIINFFPQKFFNKIAILKKKQIFRKHKVYFQILVVLPVILTTYLPV